MAADDMAILVGVSKYAYKDSFPPLAGPPNDLKLFREWLILTNGGDVPEKNIEVLESPPTLPDNFDPEDIPPRSYDFARLFKRLTIDYANGDVIRRPGRLYLYFSGHGFSERLDDSVRAAVFAANAMRKWPENICGTHYAFRAKEQALFREIVLIMDCCRDAEVNFPFDEPPINRAAVDAGAQVKLMCLYAAPKGGKAQERVIPERKNEPHGLLTHAFLKALTEAPPDNGALISSSALKKWLIGNWEAICGGIPAPKPDFYPPANEDLFFRSAYAGYQQSFRLRAGLTGGLHVEIRDGKKNIVFTSDLSPTPGQSIGNQADGTVVDLNFDGSRFKVALEPNFYQYTLSGDWSGRDTFAVPGEHGDVVL